MKHSELLETVKERPILFSGPMVRAILEDRKTQTRRIVNMDRIAKQAGTRSGKLAYSPTFNSWVVTGGDVDMALVNAPYEVGMRLWVREAFIYTEAEYMHELSSTVPHISSQIYYRADEIEDSGAKWTSPLFLPREWSRITLEITDVRVERLQEITEADAIREGCQGYERIFSPSYSNGYKITGSASVTPLGEFQELWQKINGAKAPWDSNPWVWVIGFKRV